MEFTFTCVLRIRTFLIFGMICCAAELRHISNSGEPSIDCFSPELTTEQLKAFANIGSCSENKDRKFWERACDCTVKSLPESQCPKCRGVRNAEAVLPRINNNKDIMAVSPILGAKLKTQEEQELANKKLRLFQHNNNTSGIVSNSVNFIRFGK